MTPKHNTNSHIERIRKHLRKGRTLTALEALNLFGCWNLKGRMNDLRREGFAWDKKMIVTKNKKRIAQYYAL